MFDGKNFLPNVLKVLLLTVTAIDCHPQCLDFRAPFKPNEKLTFCLDYSTLGCCGSRDEMKIVKEFDYIRSRSSSNDWESCQIFIKNILCQKCSPYAAHIYDAEGTSKARTFPGLCTGYCYSFYDTCRSLVLLLNPDKDVRSSLTGKETFCQQVAITDTLYCYPDLLRQPLLVRNLSAVNTPSATPGCLCLESVTNNLANPLWARHAGDGSGRLFVAEQKGLVRIYNTRIKRWNKNCFLDFSSKAKVSRRVGDERGFLGVAFHPQFSKNGRFFVYYSTNKKRGDVLPPELKGRRFTFTAKIVISEVRVSTLNPNKADVGSERVLLEVFQPYENHNGGELMFGLDGFLYAFIGDGGGAGDPMNASQNKSLLLGKVLRIDVDSDLSKPYTIPLDNPFVGETGSRPEIYAYGVRNIWRCGLDRGGKSRGRIVCGDVGQNAFEEINVIRKGANYGWNSREGFKCYDDTSCGHIGPEELPIHAYSHKIGQSVTGGVFYRGCENPALVGQYIYGDFSSSRLFSLTESDGTWTNQNVDLCGPSLCQGGLVGSFHDYLLSFGEDEDGEIYLLASKSGSSAKCDGSLYKIVDPVRRNDPTLCNSESNNSKRVRLSQRDKTTPTGKRNQLVPTIIKIVRLRKGKLSNTSNYEHWGANTFRAHTEESSISAHNNQLLQTNLTAENHQDRETLSSYPWQQNNSVYSATSNAFGTTGDNYLDDGNPSAQAETSWEVSSERKRNLNNNGTLQVATYQSSTTIGTSRQRPRLERESKKRGKGQWSRKLLIKKCGACNEL